jgi:sugar lactone lactonase YvrE
MNRPTLLALAASAALVFPSASGAFVLNSGDILISNHGGSQVQRLDPVSGTVSTLVSVSGTPIGLAFDTGGNMYINQNQGILKYDKGTDVLTTLFTGSGQREGLTFDPVTNHLFSVSYGGNHIEEVDLAGNLIRNISIPNTTALLGISARGGNLLVTDYGTGQIFSGSTTGASFGLVGTLTPNATYAVDLDSFGNIYANDFATGDNWRFTPSGGGFAASVFIPGLANPDNGLSIGDDNSLTISEFGADAVSVWNSNGTLRQRYSGIMDPDELVVWAPQRANPGPTVPEPRSLMLLGLGMVGFAVSRRLR